MKYKKLKIFIMLIVMSLFLGFGINSVKALEGETRVLTTTQNKNGVLHYGSAKKVEILKQYTTRYAEMRGVWVATVYNIAISKQEDKTEEAIERYKAEFRTILDRMEEFGMNTIFFQVRPSNDAFYQSELNPWSEFMLAAGQYPGWDPLEWMVEETHKRGFSFMCWMNAFRITTSTYISDGTSGTAISTSKAIEMKKQTLSALSDGNFAKKHPEYVLAGCYDEKLILNPSEPAVQKFIVDTVMEIVENYDVDGLHFDDYFYLNGYNSSNYSNTNFVGGDTYKESGENILNDLPNYEEYKKDPANYGKEAFSDFGENAIYGMEAGMNLGDFRRESINIMMRNIRAQIDLYNERTNDNVEFGTKPAAVWRSNSEFCNAGSDRCSENGSNTAEGAYSTYSDLYADSLKWVEEGLVDWVAPQVYYSFEDKYAPYADVVDWWASQVERINNERSSKGQDPIMLYIAHGIYKYRDNPEQFYRSTEATDQIRYNQHYDVIQGSALYSYENLYETIPVNESTRKSAMIDLKNLWGPRDVYPLEVGKNDADGLELVNYKLKENVENDYTLSFETLKNARAYGIYKLEEGANFDKKDVTNRIAVIYSGYEEGKKVQINLGEKADYYVVPVSLNGYVSDEITKIDFSKAEKNVAPTATKLNLDNYTGEYKTATYISGSFELKDENDDNLTYTFKIVEGTRERNMNFKDENIVVENNIVKFKWQTYGYEAENCKIKVILSDGYFETEILSPEFSLVELFTPAKTEVFVDKDSYSVGEKIQVSFNPIEDIGYDNLVIKAYLVIDGEKIDVTSNYNNAVNNKFTIDAPNKTSENCKIEIVASNWDKVTVSESNAFKLKEVVISDLNKVDIEKTEYIEGDTLKGTITIVDDNLEYKLYLVNGEEKIEIIVNDDLTFSITNLKETNNAYLELELSNGYSKKKILSQEFSVNKKIDDAVPKPKKGCESCKKDSIALMAILSISFGSTLVLFRKKFNK